MNKLIESKRIVTFVPDEHAQSFAKHISEKIPYLFGEYDSVCWWSKPKMEQGTEQYRPKGGHIKQTPSVRMEFSIPNDQQALENFTAVIKEHHPWQEPVILVFESEILKM